MNFWPRSPDCWSTGLFIITFVFQTFAIPSSSMEDTLLIGDHVLVNRESFAPKTRGLGRSSPIATFAGRTWQCFFRPSSRGFF